MKHLKILLMVLMLSVPTVSVAGDIDTRYIVDTIFRALDQSNTQKSQTQRRDDYSNSSEYNNQSNQIRLESERLRIREQELRLREREIKIREMELGINNNMYR